MTNTKNQIDGWLVIDKPYGMGSTQVVGKLKHLLHPTKIGHAGTLDPLATGVLPIALGKATRLIQFVMNDQKTYEFDIQWGTQTTSDDLDGEIIAQNQLAPTKEEILKILPKLTGKIMQTPSMFSAIKINGKRAYELARTGKPVVISPRPIFIYDLKLIHHTRKKSVFVATVSKGTYIRTLAHDIASALGMLGVVIRLHRTIDGPFHIQQAQTLETPAISEKIIPLEVVLKNIPTLTVDKITADRLQKGQRIKEEKYHLSSGIHVIQCDQKIIALVEIEKAILHPKIVF